MNAPQSIRPEFVEFIPADLEEGVLYISIPYATTTHLCACGCGSKVVLPLHPTHWKLTFDGATVSMSPSVGNWSFPCQSHYWIKNDRIAWAPKWSKERIDRGRTEDRAGRERYQASSDNIPSPTPSAQGFTARLKAIFGGKAR